MHTRATDTVVVSFVIPVRNDKQRLRHCLASIVGNDYPRDLVEIIVVDNGSTDGSATVGQEFGAVTVSSSSGRVAELRNLGARGTRGSVIAFADADHQIDRGWIAAAVNALALPDVGAAGAPYDTQPSPSWVQQLYDGLRSRPNGREDVLWLGSGNIAMSRAAFERIGGFDTGLTACEDVDLCNRLQQAGYRLLADPAMRSVHFGDPKTLKALFLGELWRGRDNLRVTFRGPKTLRHLRSALLPIAHLVALILSIVLLLAGRPGAAGIVLLISLVPTTLKAAVIVRRRARPTPIVAMQALLFVLVFDWARALALVFRGSHRARRAT